VPLYKWPDLGQHDSMYDAVANSPVQTVAIINPTNGDSNQCAGTEPHDTTWRSVVELFDGRPLVKTIGYVYTKWGNRPRAHVEASIDRYFACWRVSGIFIDEASTDTSLCSGNGSYYKELYSYIISKNTAAEVVINPGTGVDFDVWRHCSTRAMVAEVPMVAEAPASSWVSEFRTSGHFNPQGSTATYPAGYAIVLVYGVPTEVQMQEVVRQAACESITNAGGIMVLSEGGSNSLPTYDQLPEYFLQEAEYITSSWSAMCPKYPGMNSYTLAPVGGVCWWNTSDNNCEQCHAGSFQCSWTGCYKHQCSPPGGGACSNPCLNSHTLAPTGAPCWWNTSDTSCELCTEGSNQCSWSGCYKHQCSPADGSACSSPCLNSYTLAPSGAPCWWNSSDLNCEVCALGSNQCSWSGCYKHQCSPNTDASACTNECDTSRRLRGSPSV